MGLVVLLFHLAGAQSLADSWDSFMLKTEAASATVAAKIVEIAEIIETVDIVGIALAVRKDCFVEVAQMPYCSLDLNSIINCSTASKS